VGRGVPMQLELNSLSIRSAGTESAGIETVSWIVSGERA